MEFCKTLTDRPTLTKSRCFRWKRQSRTAAILSPSCFAASLSVTSLGICWPPFSNCCRISLNPILINALLSPMAFVEHTLERQYPPLVWGKEIIVKVDSDELEVSAVVPVLEEDWDASPDALRAYRKAVSRYGGLKRQGKNSPHIEFANADSDEKLVRFVQRFGPVIVRSVYKEER